MFETKMLKNLCLKEMPVVQLAGHETQYRCFSVSMKTMSDRFRVKMHLYCIFSIYISKYILHTKDYARGIKMQTPRCLNSVGPMGYLHFFLMSVLEKYINIYPADLKEA